MAGQRKTRTGTVIRDKNDKTIVVAYSWSQRHRVYKRSRRRITKFVAHDEHNEASIGDRVIIEEHRPLSKTKRWRLRQVIEAGRRSLIQLIRPKRLISRTPQLETGNDTARITPAGCR